MKEFDIKVAKDKHPVCTRNGCPVRILTYDRKDEDGFCIVGLVTSLNSPSEIVGWWREDGSCNLEPCKHPNDLMLDTPDVIGYINVYKYVDEDGTIYHTGKDKRIYGTKDEALAHINGDTPVDTIEIRWGDDITPKKSNKIKS